MKVDAKTATALSLLLGALAYPVAGIAQTSDESTSEEKVEVQVIETEDAGATDQAAEETTAETTTEEAAEATEETAEEGAEATEETAEEAAEATEETAEEAAEATEETAEEVVEEPAEGTAAIEGTEGEMTAEVEETPPPGMVITSQAEGEWLASDVIDRDIINQNGDEIGEISDILLRNEGPEGVIVDVGGFLGLGEKQIAVKWDQLSFSQEGIVLDTTEDALKNAEEFVSLEEQRKEAEAQAQAQQAEQQATQTTETLPATEGETQMQSTEEQPKTEESSQ